MHANEVKVFNSTDKKKVDIGNKTSVTRLTNELWIVTYFPLYKIFTKIYLTQRPISFPIVFKLPNCLVDFPLNNNKISIKIFVSGDIYFRTLISIIKTKKSPNVSLGSFLVREHIFHISSRVACSEASKLLINYFTKWRGKQARVYFSVLIMNYPFSPSAITPPSWLKN